MGHVYCTLFDSFFLPRGVMMLRSLARHWGAKDRIYVFCFDQKTFEVISQLGLPRVVPISLGEFETPELLAVKKSRTKGEYCWTSTPHVLSHVLIRRGEQECTYLDADLYFYQNPEISIPGPGEQTVLITEHRYSPEYDQTRTSGRFCVQFVTFKNEAESMRLLRKWADQCLEWCFNRAEDGKFGDQKYLDSWPDEGSWVKISDHPGVGLAPWNIQQFQEDGVDPVFYHFHSVHRIGEKLFYTGPYRLAPWVNRTFYRPYVEEWLATLVELSLRFGLVQVPKPLSKNPFKDWIRRWIFPSNFIRV